MMLTLIQVLLMSVTSAPTDIITNAHDPSAPLEVTLTGPDRIEQAGLIEVQVHIERPAPDEVPLTLALQLPSGVTLESGWGAESIVDGESVHLTRTLTLRVTRMPKTDLVLSVRAEGRSYGAHASASYRFGRAPESRPATPVLGPELRGAGGLRIGRPIALSLGALRPWRGAAPEEVGERVVAPPAGMRRAR